MPIARGGGSTLKLIDLSDDTTVTHAPTSITVQLQPPIGKLWRVRAVSYSCADPVGSGAGTHELQCKYEGQHNEILGMSADFGSNLSIWYGQLYAVAEYPSSGPMQLDTIQSIVATHDLPFDFIYTNSTDVDKTGTRTLHVIVLEENEGG